MPEPAAFGPVTAKHGSPPALARTLTPTALAADLVRFGVAAVVLVVAARTVWVSVVAAECWVHKWDQFTRGMMGCANPLAEVQNEFLIFLPAGVAAGLLGWAVLCGLDRRRGWSVMSDRRSEAPRCVVRTATVAAATAWVAVFLLCSVAMRDWWDAWSRWNCFPYCETGWRTQGLGFWPPWGMR